MQTAIILMSVATFGAAFYLLLKDRFWAGMFLSILPAVLAGMALDSGLSASSSKSQSDVLTYIYLVSAGLALTCFSAGVTRIQKRTQPKVNALVRRAFNQKEPEAEPLLEAKQSDPEGSWKNLSRPEKIGAILVIVVLVLVAALVTVATHARPEHAPKVIGKGGLSMG